MTQKELTAKIRIAMGRLGENITVRDVDLVLVALGKVATANAAAGTDTLLPGLGVLKVKDTPARPARTGRNPSSGEPLEIPAKPAGRKAVLVSAKALREAVEGGGV